jgi:hypothetical protein
MILRRVLSAYGLKANDGLLVPGLHVATLFGKHVIVRDLAQLWSIAETMLGNAIDPLDPRFLQDGEGGLE